MIDIIKCNKNIEKYIINLLFITETLRYLIYKEIILKNISNQ